MEQKKIGSFIAELRKEKELTQAELGEWLGVTNKTVSRWETGAYMPDLSMMAALCELFDIGINELLSGQRLSEGAFRHQADENLTFALKQKEALQRKKRISEFLGGAGTGLLVSSLYAPDTISKAVIAAIGLGMILVSWYVRSRFDKQVLGDDM